MTYSEIEAKARIYAQDDKEPYRLLPVEAYAYANEGITALFKIRPVAFFVNGRMPTTAAALEPVAPATVLAASGATTVVAPVGDRYLEALAYFVAGKFLERDYSDTMNTTVSVGYMQKFTELARM